MEILESHRVLLVGRFVKREALRFFTIMEQVQFYNDYSTEKFLKTVPGEWDVCLL